LRAYRILAMNVWLAGAELDIVARRGRTLVFCEVKSKAGDGYGDPLEMITPVKIERIHRAADAWLRGHPELRGLDIRFDVIADRSGRLEHVPRAF
jgi:putative endonuclease